MSLTRVANHWYTSVAACRSLVFVLRNKFSDV